MLTRASMAPFLLRSHHALTRQGQDGHRCACAIAGVRQNLFARTRGGDRAAYDNFRVIHFGRTSKVRASSRSGPVLSVIFIQGRDDSISAAGHRRALSLLAAMAPRGRVTRVSQARPGDRDRPACSGVDSVAGAVGQRRSCAGPSGRAGTFVRRAVSAVLSGAIGATWAFPPRRQGDNGRRRDVAHPGADDALPAAEARVRPGDVQHPRVDDRARHQGRLIWVDRRRRHPKYVRAAASAPQMPSPHSMALR